MAALKSLTIDGQKFDVGAKPPKKTFTSLDFGTEAGKKLRVVHTTGTGVTRRTIILMDLKGVDSFEFAENTFNLNNLPAGQRQGYFMIIPINWQAGKEYSLAFSTEMILQAEGTTEDYQFLLVPIGSLDNFNTAINGIGFDSDASSIIWMGLTINYAQVQGGPTGIPLYAMSTGPFTAVKGWWDNNLFFIVSRCMRGVSWLIDETKDAGYESAHYLVTVNPVTYGDFN